MRCHPLFLLALVAACGGPEFTEPSVGGPVEVVAVSGQVLDSVTGAALPGVTVGIGGKFYITDEAGGFTAMVRPGPNTVQVMDDRFEPFSHEIVAGGAGPFAFALRRLAPVPIGCELYPDHFRAVVVDLQGRKELERWARSTLTLASPAGELTVNALQWGYRALDYYQWEITIPNVDPGTDRVDWVLYDSEGHSFLGSCEPIQTLPDSGQP